MSEMYDTAINWVQDTALWNYFAGLSWQAIALLSTWAALGLIIYLKRKKLKSIKTIDVNQVFYYYYHTVIVLIGICLAIQNAAYGYSLGDTFFSMWLTATLFFLADAAFVGACYIFLPFRVALILGVISLAGLACLSSFAGLSWIMARQHVKDNYMFNDNVAQIARLDDHYYNNLEDGDKYNKRDTLRDIKALKDENKEIVDSQGGFTSESTVVYKKIADQVPYSKEQISISSRSLWAIVLVMVVVSGGGIMPRMRIVINSKKKQPQPDDLVNQGVQPSDGEAAGSKHYSRAYDVIKNKTAGDTIGITALRKKISTSKTVQNEIIRQLIDNGEMDIDTSKAVTKYTRTNPPISKVTSLFSRLRA